jgi:hypothetical protein
MTVAERLNAIDVMGGDFGFGPSVGNESIGWDANFRSDVRNRL